MTLIGKKHKPIWTPWLLRRPNVNATLQNVRPTIKPPATMNEPQITSMSTPRPTPETDAALVDHMPKDATEWSEHYLALCLHSRKLERERDEARRNAEVERLSGVAVVAMCKRQESEIKAMKDLLERVACNTATPAEVWEWIKTFNTTGKEQQP